MHNYASVKTNLTQNEDLGKLKHIFGLIQANLGRYASKQGGAQVIKWANDVKPNIFSNDKVNMAMLDSVLENGKSDYDLHNKRYKNKVNKNLPFKFPGEKNDEFNSGSDIENGFITLIDPKGGEHKIYRDKLNEAMKKYPELKVKKESFNAAKI